MINIRMKFNAQELVLQYECEEFLASIFCVQRREV